MWFVIPIIKALIQKKLTEIVIEKVSEKLQEYKDKKCQKNSKPTKS
jgi:hypothetical protein